MPVSNVYLKDCMDGMKEFPDKFFDLAIVDPPYGIGYDKLASSVGGKMGKCARKTVFKNSNWDNSPPPT